MSKLVTDFQQRATGLPTAQHFFSSPKSLQKVHRVPSRIYSSRQFIILNQQWGNIVAIKFSGLNNQTKQGWGEYLFYPSRVHMVGAAGAGGTEDLPSLQLTGRGRGSAEPRGCPERRPPGSVAWSTIHIRWCEPTAPRISHIAPFTVLNWPQKKRASAVPRRKPTPAAPSARHLEEGIKL